MSRVRSSATDSTKRIPYVILELPPFFRLRRNVSLVSNTALYSNTTHLFDRQKHFFSM